MGQHTANPPKISQTVHNRAHQWIVCCKHIILETVGGFIAIIIFEAFRADWLNLLGHAGTDEAHQVAIMVMNNSIM